MSKTAAEWRDSLSTHRPVPPVAWIQAIIDDARAGMVSEGECKHSPCLECAFQKVTAERDKAEVELAKAWCDGRDAAAAECGDSNAAPLARIRALQPPGGKAK